MSLAEKLIIKIFFLSGPPNSKRQSTTFLLQSCAEDGILSELFPVSETSIWQDIFHRNLVLQTLLQEKPSENPMQQN